MLKTIRSIGKEENDYLATVAEKINREYFEGSINSDVVWAIPRSGVGRAGSNELSKVKLPEIATPTLVEILKLQAEGEDKRAFELLKPLAETKNDYCVKLMIILCNKLGLDEEFHYWAKLRNFGANQIILPSPGSIEKKDDEWGIIKIHTCLAVPDSNTIPPYVLKYIIFHEMLHEYLDTSIDNPHPEYFLKFEGFFKKKRRSTEWLENKGFSTLDKCLYTCENS